MNLWNSRDGELLAPNKLFYLIIDLPREQVLHQAAHQWINGKIKMIVKIHTSNYPFPFLRLFIHKRSLRAQNETQANGGDAKEIEKDGIERRRS